MIPDDLFIGSGSVMVRSDWLGIGGISDQGRDDGPYSCLTLIRDTNGFDTAACMTLILQVFDSPINALLH